MDLIILLIIFGVISALGKNSKKQVQNKRPGSSLSQNQRSLSTTQNRSRSIQSSTLSGSRESLQDSLTSIFNALAGEEILKSPEEKKREEEQARKLLEEREVDMVTVSDFTYDEVNEPESYVDEVQELREDNSEGLQIITLDDEDARNDTDDYSLNLEDVKRGIIWHEILDKPISLRK